MTGELGTNVSTENSTLQGNAKLSGERWVYGIGVVLAKLN